MELATLLAQQPSYVGELSVYLETADRRLTVEPYGPHHPEAVGRVFRLEHHEASPSSISYVKSIAPAVFDTQMGEWVPLWVFAEADIGTERALLARIDYRRGHCGNPVDLKKRHGTWLLLVLYVDKPRPALSDGAKRAQLILAMLDYEHGFQDDMTREERETLDVERQTFAMQMGWPQMSIAELEEQCRALLGKLPY